MIEHGTECHGLVDKVVRVELNDLRSFPAELILCVPSLRGV